MLRLRAAFATALVVALVVVAPVAAAHLKQDLAWGSGVRAPYTTDSPAPTFQFNASSNPDGTGPAGTFIWEYPTGGFVATVTCLNVNGKHATLVGEVNTATGLFAGSEGFWFEATVQDNGAATKRHPSPDVMSGVSEASPLEWQGVGVFSEAQLCANPYAYVSDAMVPLVSGDLTVIDR